MFSGILSTVVGFMGGGTILPLVIVVVLGTAAVGGDFMLHEARKQGAAEATAECAQQAAKLSADTAKRIENQAQKHAVINQEAQTKVDEAVKRAEAAHRALDKERADHAKTKEAKSCESGCTVRLP